MIAFAIKTLDESQYIDLFSGIKDPKPEEKARLRDMVETRATLVLLQKESPRLETQLRSQRAAVQKHLNGRAVLIGWTATSEVADQVGTPLHAACPGIPVILISGVASGVPEEVAQRVTAWVRKPFEMGEVIDVLGQNLAPTSGPLAHKSL